MDKVIKSALLLGIFWYGIEHFSLAKSIPGHFLLHDTFLFFFGFYIQVLIQRARLNPAPPEEDYSDAEPPEDLFREPDNV